MPYHRTAVNSSANHIFGFGCRTVGHAPAEKARAGGPWQGRTKAPQRRGGKGAPRVRLSRRAPSACTDSEKRHGRLPLQRTLPNTRHMRLNAMPNSLPMPTDSLLVRSRYPARGTGAQGPPSSRDQARSRKVIEQLPHIRRTK
jgi:hypothetical protein